MGSQGNTLKPYFVQAWASAIFKAKTFLRFGEYRSSWTNDIDYEELKKEVIQPFEWAKEITDIDAGSYPVIFAPGEVGNLCVPYSFIKREGRCPRDITSRR